MIIIEPSAVDEDKETANVSDEENRDITVATVSGEEQDSNLSINGTTSPLLSTKHWNELNIDSKEVSISN